MNTLGIAGAAGNTPLIALEGYARFRNLKAKIFAKAEGFNPSGSVKDRVAAAILRQAERRGRLRAGAVVVEPTSGNTGVALSAFCAAAGVRAVLVMPENMSVERQKLIRAYGGEIILTPAEYGMGGAIAAAKEFVAATSGAFIAGQFENPANSAVHFVSTGPEIYRALRGQADILVAGVGTGGTLAGVGRYLKSRNGKVKIYAVEPSLSPVLSGGKAGRHCIQGIGAGFVPPFFAKAPCDGIICVSDEEAKSAAAEVMRTDGISAGISSGAALCAAARLAALRENNGKNIVAIFPDGVEKYLSVI